MFTKSVLHLQPHPTQKSTLVSCEVLASIHLQSGGTLRAIFEVTSPVALKIPELRGSQPTQSDRLWETTCFELFLQTPGDSEYLEINVAPRGDWAFYAFSAYRERADDELFKKQTDGFQIKHEKLQMRDDRVRVDFSFDLQDLGRLFGNHLKAGLRIGIAAVLESENGEKAYFALAHASDKPDFHRSESFIHLLLPAETEISS